MTAKPLTLTGRAELLAEIEQLRGKASRYDEMAQTLTRAQTRGTELLQRARAAESALSAVPECGALVIVEFHRADGVHALMNSAYEGYAVLLEEVDELWDEVKKGGDEPRSIERMRKEAIQVGAMALRFLHDICGVTDDEAAS